MLPAYAKIVLRVVDPSIRKNILSQKEDKIKTPALVENRSRSNKSRHDRQVSHHAGNKNHTATARFFQQKENLPVSWAGRLTEVIICVQKNYFICSMLAVYCDVSYKERGCLGWKMGQIPVERRY